MNETSKTPDRNQQMTLADTPQQDVIPLSFHVLAACLCAPAGCFAA